MKNITCFSLISMRAVILIILWDFLTHFEAHFLIFSAATYVDDLYKEQYSLLAKILPYFYFCLYYLLFPIFGLLADVWIGRYKAITFGIIMCFLSFMIAGIVYVINKALQTTILFEYVLVSYILVSLLGAIGYINIRSNLIQYNVDQLVGGSSHQLSIVIYLQITSLSATFILLQFLRCLVKDVNALVPLFLVLSGVAASIVLVTHSLCKHWLENVSLVDNPISLIIKVLNYARKHRYPENRSALTYWEEESPSRLDLGKRKYGGPFTEEEVENVKTVLRMIPLFTAVIGLGCSRDTYWKTLYGIVPILSPDVSCLISVKFFAQLTSFICMTIYVILPNTYFYRFMPSMLKKIGIGLIFAFFALISYMIIVTHSEDKSNGIYFFNTILLVPHVLMGIGYFLIYPSSLEFTIAQSPVQMRSAMVGLWFITLGIGYGINISLKHIFRCTNSVYICLDFYFYLTKSCIVLFLFILYIIWAKCYKFRVRENEVNIRQIVDDHYQRYMDQDELYNASVSSDESP